MADSIVTGLIAAAVTLVVAFLTQFIAERYRRFHDGSALAAGIVGELSAYKGGPETLQKRLKQWIQVSKEGKQATLKFRLIDKPVDLFFDASVGKIGVLGPELVEHIVFVYTNIRAFRIGLELVTKHYADMSEQEFQERCELCHQSLTRAIDRGEFLIPFLRQRAIQRFNEPFAKLPSPPEFAV